MRLLPQAEASVRPARLRHFLLAVILAVTFSTLRARNEIMYAESQGRLGCRV
jgi:hypothetical protein